MLIACVNVGTKYPDEYVHRLRRGVGRHTNGTHEFVCFSDHPIDGIECRDVPPELPGWWAKVHLFSLGIPLFYMDLDVAVVGDLEPAIAWDGFGIINDWWLQGFNSSVMKLTGAEGFVSDGLTPAIMRSMYQGDQQWISKCLPDSRTFPPMWFPSYKAGGGCQAAVPEGAKAVIFHGSPKPADCGGWVTEHWI